MTSNFGFSILIFFLLKKLVCHTIFKSPKKSVTTSSHHQPKKKKKPVVKAEEFFKIGFKGDFSKLVFKLKGSPYSELLKSKKKKKERTKKKLVSFDSTNS